MKFVKTNELFLRKTFLILYLIVFFGTEALLAQTIESNEILVFPEHPATEFIVESGQTFRASSSKSIVLKPGTHFHQGSNVLLRIERTYSIPSAPNNPAANNDMNWIQSKSFDLYGNVIAESKGYYDSNGRLLQNQFKDIEKGHVLASQPIYDVSGRPSLQTLAAPTNNAGFAYKADFVVNSNGTPYDYKNFDRYKVTGTTYDRTQSPDAVGGKNVPGSLGWYYGPGNSWEPYNDITDYPYSRQAYAYDGSGIPTRAGGAGDAYRLGAGHEGYLYSVPVKEELNHYWSVRRQMFDQSELGQNLEGSVDQPAVMSVAVDADGTAVFTISLGGNVLVSGGIGTELPVQKTIVSTQQSYFGLPTAGYVSFSPANGRVLNLIDGQQIDVTSGIVNLAAGWYSFENDGTSTQIGSNFGFKDLSYNFYNQLGGLVASIAPEGVKQLIAGGVGSYSPSNRSNIPFISENTYDIQGRLVKSKSPDATGSSEFVYRRDGQIRFSQNAKQREDGRFSYSNYDRLGRVIEGGEYKPGNGGVAFNATRGGGTPMESILENVGAGDGLSTGTKYDVIRYTYDVVDNTHSQGSYEQDSYYLRGALSKSEKYQIIEGNAPSDQNLISRTWYNYNAEGQIDWQIKNIIGLGLKTTDYSYDEFGAIRKTVYQRHSPAEFMAYYYEYDKDRRLVEVYTNTVDNPMTKSIHARYHYYLHGPLKRIELGDNLQGIDYIYTADGKLKSINNPNPSFDPGEDGMANSFAKDVFGYSLEYHAGDYSRTGTNIVSVQTGSAQARYNGLLNGVIWSTKKTSSAGGARTAVMNSYNYDDDYNLKSNNWGEPDFSGRSFGISSGAWQERGLSYDLHGNIKTLQRTGATGNVLANYQYNYVANSNKLASVSGYAAYSYDALGQLASETKDDQSKYMDYDVSGKVTKIFKDAAKTQLAVSFAYDEDGNRILKLDHLQGVTTWYVDGNVYSGSQLIEQPIPSGQFYRQGGVYRYQLTDHVGSVRAIINRNKLSDGSVDVVYSADYYPFGTELGANGIPSRYGYQGKYAEKDSETGYNNFYLRNYDPAIGRWLSVDPYGQYHSPYVGMGNNPVSGFDPDGGWSWLGAAVRYLGALGTGQNPSGFGQRSDGEWGFYTSLGGNSSETATVMGSANFDSKGTNYHIYLNAVNNSWIRNGLMSFRNTITGETRSTMHTGAIEPVYVETNFIGGPVSIGKVGWQAASLAIKVNKATSKIEKVSQKISEELPTQIHHFATNKSKTYTEQMEKIAGQFKLDLDGAWNKAPMPHRGRHPNKYHDFVLEGMQKAAAGANGNRATFLNLFNQYVKQPVIQNPGLLRKSGW